MSSLLVSGDRPVTFLFTLQLSNNTGIHADIHAVAQQFNNLLCPVQPEEPQKQP